MASHGAWVTCVPYNVVSLAYSGVQMGLVAGPCERLRGILTELSMSGFLTSTLRLERPASQHFWSLFYL